MFTSAKGDDPVSRVKALAVKLRERAPDMKHGHALYIVSNYLGFRDWNVLAALLKTNPARIEKLLNEKEAK